MNNIVSDLLLRTFSYIPYSVNYLIICKEWNIYYRKAIGRYPIQINLDNNITQKDFDYLFNHIYNPIHTLYMYVNNNIYDLSCIKGIHTFCIYGDINIYDLTSLKGIHTLHLYINGNFIKDLTPLQGIHTLRTTIDFKDLTPLKGIHTLCLYNLNISDISFLVGIKKLYLDACRNITDLSALISLERLHLSYLAQTLDVSSLININKLSIIDCCEIKGIKKLNLKYVKTKGSIKIYKKINT